MRTRDPWRVSGAGYTGAAPRAEELAAHVGERLRQAVAGLEALRNEVEALGSLAASERARHQVPAPKLLTVRQAASTLGMSQSTVHLLIREQKLDSVKIAGARRISVESIDAFIEGLSEQKIGA